VEVAAGVWYRAMGDGRVTTAARWHERARGRQAAGEETAKGPRKARNQDPSCQRVQDAEALGQVGMAAVATRLTRDGARYRLGGAVRTERECCAGDAVADREAGSCNALNRSTGLIEDNRLLPRAAPVVAPALGTFEPRLHFDLRANRLRSGNQCPVCQPTQWTRACRTGIRND
jgi:hypothetical protein